MQSNHVIVLCVAIIVIVILLILTLSGKNNTKRSKTGGNKTTRLKAGINNSPSENYQQSFDEILSAYLQADIYNSKCREIVSYALRGGKRLRPNTLLHVAHNYNCHDENMIRSAVVIEYIHCASLIFDDIMDKDLVRRGRKTVHAKYGTGYAQAAALYLLTLAINHQIEFLSREQYKPHCAQALKGIFQDVTKGLIEGQIKDLFDSSVDPEEQKTSSLFIYTITVPWIYSHHHLEPDEFEQQLSTVRQLGKNIGILYQLQDDFSDYLTDKSANYVRQYGKEKSIQYMKKLHQESMDICKDISLQSLPILNM